MIEVAVAEMCKRDGATVKGGGIKQQKRYVAVHGNGLKDVSDVSRTGIIIGIKCWCRTCAQLVSGQGGSAVMLGDKWETARSVGFISRNKYVVRLDNLR